MKYQGAEKRLMDMVLQVSAAKVRQRFTEDRTRVLAASGGVIDLVEAVEYAHASRIGVPGWNLDGTVGINGGVSMFGVKPDEIPGWCGTFEEMVKACSAVVEIGGGALRLMLHLGLHGVGGRKRFRHDRITFDNLAPWLEWEARMQAAGHDVMVSWDPTFWGGPKPDGMTLGSPNDERRGFFLEHMKTGLVAMIAFADGRSGNLKGIPVDCNVWLSGSTARPWANPVGVLQRVIAALEEAFGSVKWKGKISVTHEGKAPCVQSATRMEVDNTQALLLAMRLNQGWLLDIGHHWPLEDLAAQLQNARAHGLRLGAHITFDPCGCDADLTIGTRGPAAEFIDAALKLEGGDEVPKVLDGDGLKAVMAARRERFSAITKGVDSFERGLPPEVTMLQGVMAYRKLVIRSLVAAPFADLLAARSGSPVDRVVALVAKDVEPVDLENCLCWYRLEHDLDPNWLKAGVDAFLKRTGS